jgi:hypothetical protein
MAKINNISKLIERRAYRFVNFNDFYIFLLSQISKQKTLLF